MSSLSVSVPVVVIQRIGRTGCLPWPRRSRLPQGSLLQQLRHAHKQGYQAIGSFHSENVDELMIQSEQMYQPPKLPFLMQDHPLESSNDFLLDRDQWTFLNHGAFGAALRVGYDRAAQWRYHLERQPLRYHDRELLPHLVYSARRLAQFCQAKPLDAFTLIPNVTYGLNTVLRGYSQCYKDRKQHHVIVWDTTYGSFKKMAHELFPGRVTEIPVSEYFDQWRSSHSHNNFPEKDPSLIFEMALRDTIQNLSDNQVDKKFENALLILDHTTSNTALNMPLQSLSKLAKERNMLVLVDGAHGVLAQDLVLNETHLPHVDFYVGNGHKWLACPRGIGFLYCPRAELRETVLRLPAVISHGVGQGFQSRFLWDGCRDYAAALSVPAVLDYWESTTKDPVELRVQIKSNLKQAVQLLSKRWHGATSDEEIESTLLAPWQVHAPMMVLLRLPDSVQSSPSTSVDAKAIQDFLYDNFIEVPIKCVLGVLYVRLSCHVYNELHEYERLGDVMHQFPSV
jgi:selenocysteine lyase/cysteine desulfurase